MSKYRRRVFIDLFFQQWDAEKYANLGTMLCENYMQALRLLKDEGPALAHAKAHFGLEENQLEEFRAAEVEYFANLGKEPEYETKNMAYVELLQTLREMT